MTKRVILANNRAALGLDGPMSVPGPSTVQATVTGTGAVGATVVIRVSNDPNATAWLVAATITLSGTGTATDGLAIPAGWMYMHADVTAISGTSAVVNVAAVY